MWRAERAKGEQQQMDPNHTFQFNGELAFKILIFKRFHGPNRADDDVRRVHPAGRQEGREAGQGREGCPGRETDLLNRLNAPSNLRMVLLHFCTYN